MKILNKIFLAAGALAMFGAFTACTEEATLDGANVVYVEISPDDLVLTAGQRVPVQCLVTNESGDKIPTTVEWTVDDPSVARFFLDTTYRTKTDIKKFPVVDPVTGDTLKTVDGNDSIAADTTYTVLSTTVTETVEALKGAQGKSTFLRATLPNGKYAIRQISVVKNSLAGSLTAYTEGKRSYFNYPRIDTVFFKLEPMELLEEYTPTFKFDITEVIEGSRNADESMFRCLEDSIITIDSLNLVGVLYIAPRITGKARCTMTLGDENTSVSDKVDFDLYPEVSCGFEIDGKRPLAQKPNPSNVKVQLRSVTCDVNSEYRVGVCVGVEGGFEEDLLKAETNFDWEIEGSGLIVESTEIDRNYDGGFVSYLNLRSGSREGLSIVRFNIPGETLTCNISVENYDVAHPTDTVKIEYLDKVVNFDTVRVNLDDVLPFKVYIEPEKNFAYHIPEFVSSNESVVTIAPRNSDAGYERTATAVGIGRSVLTATSLGKSASVVVEVLDRVAGLSWKPGQVSTMMLGDSDVLTSIVTMKSGVTSTNEKVTFTSNNEKVIKLTERDNTTVTVDAVGEGTAEIEATVGGYTIRHQITVNAPKDVYMPDDADDTDDVSISDYFDWDDETIELRYQTDNVDFLWQLGGLDVTNLAGTYTGSEGTIDVNGITYDIVAYEVTITVGEHPTTGDEGIFLSGVITRNDGTKVYLTNVFFLNGN